MSLVSDQELMALSATLVRLQQRVAEWLTDSDDETDQAKRFPMWVIDAVSKISKCLTAIAALDLERARLKLAAKGKGQPVLSDEEYEAGMAELQQQAMKSLSTSELAMEIDRRSRMES